jgi:hypothetical protein
MEEKQSLPETAGECIHSKTSTSCIQ